MYRLYGSLGSGSVSVEAALAQTGVEYEVLSTETGQGQHLTKEYKAINPRQQVPALELPDGSVMTEGSAMMLHLADAFPDAMLAPSPGSSARAQHDRWLIFMAVNIYEGELRKAYSARYSEDAAHATAVQSSAVGYVNRHYDILEAAIKGPFLLGDRMTMADIYLWMLASWMDKQWLADHCPKVAALADTVRQQPLIAPVDKTHFG